MKILVAEDERELSRPLVTILERSGYSADTAYDGLEAYEKICCFGYDLIILDIMMPKLSGLEVLERIRTENVKTPVLILTAKAETDDKIAGLDKGADDYLTKPFVMGEFLARVRALTRRNNSYAPEKLEYYGAELFKSNNKLSGRNVSFRLNNKEYALAEMFFNSPEKGLSCEQLIERVWKEDEKADIQVLDMYVNFIKNKLAAINEKIAISKADGLYIMEVK